MNTKVIINEQKEFDFKDEKSQIFLNNEAREYEVIQISSNLYTLSMKNQVHEIEILSITNDNYELKIDGVFLSAELLDHQKQILKALGIEVAAEEKVDNVVSPMPGSIIEISCSTGDEVEKGTPLLILEAMKMENVIKSPAAGTIKEIKVSIGESVEKNQVLLVF
ncbi:MAG: acetyl-CoA carboxylase biotin carboxyl carrier protein subunit [Cyclobacteriaceae bacterium]